MELINKLSQYKLLSLGAAWGCQNIRNCSVDQSVLLAGCAIQVAVKAHVSWQLETLILRSEWPHAFIWPHCPGACK